ncbi:MAG: Twitching mobility protein [Verrucomicrobia subdivision 3 bacterium]|nr:Twitching mobility protein [Limisphaerales bacterium]MCS1413704.1 Twitching mobility protein [Limisphaerales bacterium]
MEIVPTKSSLSQLLCWCEEQEASDLHIQTNAAPRIRREGQLIKINPHICPELDTKRLHQLLRDGFPKAIFQKVTREKEVDLSFQHRNTRYRANFSKQQSSQSCSFRRIPARQYNLSDLRLPSTLTGFVKELRGLVLAAGPTGQGKSTTMRALIQTLNETRSLRIISIEDPIEYIFTAQECQIKQREVGVDTDNFASGIRNAMRQDPDVIFVGEIRDRQSIHAAMQASETGPLILTTLHADSTAQAIARICELYPTDEQSNITGLLARNLKSVICQRLIPDTEGKLHPLP